jgi:hypothetical protein
MSERTSQQEQGKSENIGQKTVEANDKIEHLEKQQAQLYAVLMAKQPPAPLQDTTAATIKALNDKTFSRTSKNDSTSFQ